jgi:hypothetical protein
MLWIHVQILDFFEMKNGLPAFTSAQASRGKERGFNIVDSFRAWQLGMPFIISVSPNQAIKCRLSG